MIAAMRPASPFSALLLTIAVLVVPVASGCGDADGDEEPSTQAGQTQGQSQDQTEASQAQTQSQSQKIPPSPEFERVLGDLKAAALSDGTYKAVRQSNSLDAEENAMIDAFCETAWQLEINGEEDRLSRTSYMVGRIRNLAEFNLSSPDRAAVEGALDELRKVVGLASLDPELNHRYKKACYQ